MMLWAPAGDKIQILVTSATSNTTSPTNATAVFRLESDGDIGATLGNNTIQDAGDWIIPKSSAGAAYECQWTSLGNDPATTPGAAGTWLALSSTRTWSILATPGGGVVTASFTLEIRRASDGVVLATENISLAAESIV